MMVKYALYIIYIIIYIIYKYNTNINISFLLRDHPGWSGTFPPFFENQNELMYHCTTVYFLCVLLRVVHWYIGSFGKLKY